MSKIKVRTWAIARLPDKIVSCSGLAEVSEKLDEYDRNDEIIDILDSLLDKFPTAIDANWWQTDQEGDVTVKGTEVVTRLNPEPETFVSFGFFINDPTATIKLPPTPEKIGEINYSE